MIHTSPSSRNVCLHRLARIAAALKVVISHHLPIDRVGVVWVVLEGIGEDAAFGEAAANWEGVSHNRPLGLPPDGQQLPHIVDQTCQLEPFWGEGEGGRTLGL